jgi:hypothetical protein
MRLCFNNSDMELLEYVKHERAERFRKCFKAMKNFVSRKESAPKELDRLLQNKLPEGDLVKGCIIHTENAKPHAMKNCSLDIIVSYIRKHTVDTCFILEFEAQLVFVYNWK